METENDVESERTGPRPEDAPTAGQRRSRRLSDKILLTFHSACDVHEYQVAAQLLETLEWLISRSNFRSPLDRRRNTEALVAAHERLWNLRNGSSLT